MIKYKQWSRIIIVPNGSLSLIIENFDVVCNDGQYRGSNHPFKLIFQKGTIMKSQDILEIPQYIYRFTPFDEILNGVASTDVLVGNFLLFSSLRIFVTLYWDLFATLS